MKKLYFTSLLVLIFTGSIFALTNPSNNKTKVIESNLLEGINSNNHGLQISSAYFLGEIKSEKAILPLMRILRSSNSSGARSMAALSLIKIGNAQGIYMVMREAQFNNSEKVRKLCRHLYRSYLSEKYF